MLLPHQHKATQTFDDLDPTQTYPNDLKHDFIAPKIALLPTRKYPRSSEILTREQRKAFDLVDLVFNKLSRSVLPRNEQILLL